MTDEQPDPRVALVKALIENAFAAWDAQEQQMLEEIWKDLGRPPDDNDEYHQTVLTKVEIIEHQPLPLGAISDEDRALAPTLTELAVDMPYLLNIPDYGHGLVEDEHRG